jgi:hypothetical protein
MKQLAKVSCLSDEVIERLFNSENSDDWKLAAVFVIQKYKYQPAIDTFFRGITNYRIRKHVNYHIAGGSYLGTGKIYIYVDRESWLQIIVGNYGLWCKSLRFPPLVKSDTIIEEI